MKSCGWRSRNCFTKRPAGRAFRCRADRQWDAVRLGARIDSPPAIPDGRSSSAEQSKPRLNSGPDGRNLYRRATETQNLADRGNLRQRQTAGRDDDTVPDQLVRADDRPPFPHGASL